MVEFNSLKELLDMYPSFLDRTPNTTGEKGSVHYRVNKVKNEQYQDLRTSIKILSYCNSLERPLSIWKEQEKPKEYSINCKVQIPNIRRIQVHKIDPRTQKEILNTDNSIYYAKNFTQESETDYYTVTLNETCGTTIPVYQYILTVETYDEYYLCKGYPENDNSTIVYIKDKSNDDNTVTYTPVFEDLEDNYNTNEYDENYIRFINTYTVPSEYPVGDCEVIVYSKPIETYTNDGTVYGKWTQESINTETITIDDKEYLSYMVEYDEERLYCIVMVAPDNYFTTNYYPFNYLHDYEIFEHDTNLDVLGAKLNVSRREHIQVSKPSDLPKTVPSYYNRLTEDDYRYGERIQTYISNYGEKYLPELEIWKEYGLPSILTNRKEIIASQCDSYMWTDCCTDNTDMVKNKTSINLITNDLTCQYTIPKKITVRVTCEDNESIYDVLDGFVEYRFNGENHYARVSNGYATLTYTHEDNTDWGTIPLQIQYTGYDEYDESNTINTEITFTGKQLMLTTNGNPINSSRRERINLQAQVTSKYDNNISGVIGFYYHGQLLCESTIKDNRVIIPYNIPDSISIGVQDIVAVYYDDREEPEYSTTSSTFKLNILKERLKTHLEAQIFHSHNLLFHLHDEEHNRVGDRILYIYEEDKQIGTVKTNWNYYAHYTDNNFEFNFNKKYYVEFKGDLTYKPCKYRFYPLPRPVYKEAHFITLLHNNYLGFKLHDGRDNTLWDKKVTVRLNGTLKETIETINGWNWIEFDSFGENDEATLTFNGDDDYNSCTCKVGLEAPSDAFSTSIILDSNEYNTEKGKPITITGKLLNHDGEPMVDFPVMFYHRDSILDDTYIDTVYTDSMGDCSITYTPTSDKSPDYVRLVFKGNDAYNPSTSIAKIKVGAGTETILTGELEDNNYKCLDEITLRLTDNTGNPVSNRLVRLCEHTTVIDTGTGEDIGGNNCFTSNTTDTDGYVRLKLDHSSGTVSLSAVFDGDDTYKGTQLLLGEVNLSKRNLCIETHPARDGILHSTSSINTRVYDCTGGEGVNGVELSYYFIRQSTGKSQELTPVLTTSNALGVDGYAYRQINYSKGEYLVGVTVTDPTGRYNGKSTVYSNINNKTLWEGNKYLYPITIVEEGKIQTNISLSSDTIVSGENMVATLLNEAGNPLADKTVWFADENKNRFATATTDQFGHARKQFNMSEQKNKMMYYGWDSDEDLYDSCENVAHVNVTRRSVCFDGNNLGPEQTVSVGFEYVNKLIDCRTGEPLQDKWVSIVFERFKKDTTESLGRSSPYYLKSDSNGYLKTTDGEPLRINLAPSGNSGEYHYTYELYYYHDLNDTQDGYKYEQHDGYYNDKKSSPIKFYTKKPENSVVPNIVVSASPVEVWSGKSYELKASLPSDATGTVLFRLSSGAYLNKNEPAEVIDGVAVWTGIDTAQPGQTFRISAEFTSNNYLKYDDSTNSNTITINTVTGENKATRLIMQNYAVKGGNDTSNTSYVYATLSTSDGVGLSDENVEVNIGGVFYPMESVGEGKYRRLIEWTGLKQTVMYATYQGKENMYEGCSSESYNLISYKNRTGYGNLWILYKESVIKGESLECYLCDSNMDPISGYPVTVELTRDGYDDTYSFSTPSDATGCITSTVLNYNWSNVTVHCKVIFNSNTGYISYGANKGYVYNLPKGSSVSFDFTYKRS